VIPRLHRPALLAALALLAAALAPLFAQAQSGATPLLYEVKSDTNVVYLYGTIHVGTSAMYR
jgi:uncharacterized protein YbaP (TraB family)